MPSNSINRIPYFSGMNVYRFPQTAYLSDFSQSKIFWVWGFWLCSNLSKPRSMQVWLVWSTLLGTFSNPHSPMEITIEQHSYDQFAENPDLRSREWSFLSLLFTIQTYSPQRKPNYITKLIKRERNKKVLEQGITSYNLGTAWGVWN